MSDLDLTSDIVELTTSLVNIASVSHHEAELADAVERALAPLSHLELTRIGDNIIARTTLGRPERVVIAGHLDTVPPADNMTARLEGEMLYGIGACDMKGGVAVALALAARAVNPNHDVTFVFYAAEEVEDSFNGLAHVLREAPELLAADFAILMEPSDAGIEAGCQGSMRANVTTRGKRAHSARSWVGDNAIQHSAQVLQTLIDYQPRTVDIDGLGYREGLSAVRISGGIAGNVIPDECVVTVNYRYAPDRSPAEAEAHVRELFAAYEVEVTDNAPPALPGLDRPAAKAFVAAVGVEPRPKFGWTDVARFSAIGVPAVNFGPGDPLVAHTSDEHVPVAHLRSTMAALTTWLGIDAV